MDIFEILRNLILSIDPHEDGSGAFDLNHCFAFIKEQFSIFKEFKSRYDNMSSMEDERADIGNTIYESFTVIPMEDYEFLYFNNPHFCNLLQTLEMVRPKNGEWWVVHIIYIYIYI